MSTNKNIQEEIERTLASADSFQKRKAKPFLYTRLQFKLEKDIKNESYNWFFDTPLLKPVLATLFILINIITIWQFSTTENSMLSDRQEIIDSFTNEYAFNQSTETYFEIENE